jgi:hypothetical protein
MKMLFSQTRTAILLLLLLAFFQACATLSGTSDAEYGTIINTAKLPANNLFPDFESNIPDTALASETSARYLTRTSSTESVPLHLEDPTAFAVDTWSGVFVNGGISSVHNFRQELETLGTQITAANAAAGITKVKSTPQSVTVTGVLLNVTGTWTVEFSTDLGNNTYARFYFYNATTGEIVGTYLVDFENGVAVKGIFAAVDPVTLAAGADNGIRFLGLAFDFSNPQSNLIVMRMEQYHLTHGNFYTYHVHQQCDLTTTACLGEYQEIISAAPERQLSEMGTRFSWQESNNAVCLADIDSTGAETATLHTYAFLGPQTPAASDISVDTCSVAVPKWGGSVYRVDALPMRYEDTSPVGGTALSYFGDGRSTASWETLNADLIATWLSASRF